MKFRVERDVLADGVAWAARALPSRPSIPTLSGVLISSDDSELTLSGFDMEQAARVQVEATIDEPGQVLVSGRLLADIARSLPAAPVVIATEGSRLEVQCGRSSFVLPTLPVDEYPQLPEMPAPVGSVGGGDFAHAVAQVAIAAGRDDTLPMLLGVRLEIDGDQVTMAATDRYRLAVREFTWNPEQSGFQGAALVPAKILADTAKLLAGAKRVSVAYAPGTSGEGLMGFEGDGRRTTTRLLDGEFPKYRQLLPADTSSVATVEKAALVEAVKRVSLVAERNTPVRLVFSGEEVALQAGSGDEAQATESLESRIVGESIEIAFNPHYLLDGLGAIDSPEVDISFTGSAKPAVLTQSGSDSADSYKYLLMPVRLSS
ncbi:MAG: DNA polymerase III subunit beta [Candidatus Nanopelagicales bacterium]